MMWRNSTWKCTGAAMIAVVACGVVPAGSVWADQPEEPTPTGPDESVALPESPADVPSPEPATDHRTGTIVAVGLPPVPPSSVAPAVAVGQPPVPPAPAVAVGQPPVPSTPAVAVGQSPVPSAPAVAVGQPPVPSAPALAVGQPPVPSAALLAAADAAFGLVTDCL